MKEEVLSRMEATRAMVQNSRCSDKRNVLDSMIDVEIKTENQLK